MPTLIRITTVPISLKLLITGQMKYMAANGYKVRMVSADGPEISEVAEYEKVPHDVVPMTRRITPFQDLVSLLKMIQYMRVHKPDIVHTHTPKAGLIGLMAAWLCRVPVRIHTVAGLPLQTRTGFTHTLLTYMEKLTYACATEVWPNSPGLYSYIKKEELTKEEKLHMIAKGSSNGIDLTHFSPEKLDPNRLQELKDELQIRDDRRYLLAVGRMVKDKGIIELLQAFELVKATHPDIHLLLVGPFEEEGDELPQSIRQKIDTDPAITHKSWTDEIPYYLHLATMLVHPSHREGFPNVLLQAGAMGCPVVCSDIPGNNDIIQNEETGLLFDTGKKAAIAQKITWALDRPEQLDNFAAQLQSEIIQFFPRENIHKEINRQYKRLLNGVK